MRVVLQAESAFFSIAEKVHHGRWCLWRHERQCPCSPRKNTAAKPATFGSIRPTRFAPRAVMGMAFQFCGQVIVAPRNQAVIGLNGVRLCILNHRSGHHPRRGRAIQQRLQTMSCGAGLRIRAGSVIPASRTGDVSVGHEASVKRLTIRNLSFVFIQNSSLDMSYYGRSLRGVNR